MNAGVIADAAGKIAELSEALIWLRENGEQALNHRAPETFGVSFSLNSCSALRGSTQAAKQLAAVARTFSPEIRARAIEDAENTIEILRQRIADEVSTSKTE